MHNSGPSTNPCGTPMLLAFPLRTYLTACFMTGTFFGGSEFKCPGSVAKCLILDHVGKQHTPYTKSNPKPTN